MRTIFGACALTLTALPVGAAVQCADPLFEVVAKTPEMAQMVCRAASEAREVLASCNAPIEAPIEISVRESLTGEMGPCLGIYHCGESRIEILSPDAMARARDVDGAFAEISDDAYWQSVLVHELTHAAYDGVPCPFTHCVATTEYAGYAMQVQSLPDDEKERFGTQVTLSGPPSRDGLSAIILYMSPERFAKMAWLHFSAHPAPCELMGKIMSGKTFFDREPI